MEKTTSLEETTTRTISSAKSIEQEIQELLGEILMEIGKAKKILDILLEQELTPEEIVEFDNLTEEEEKVLRMRWGISEPLKGSLDRNIYEKEGLR